MLGNSISSNDGAQCLPPFETWSIRKPSVEAEKGLVASQHYFSSDVGARVLGAGGNAVDAAIATSFAIGTVEPWMSGLGGGGYMLIHLGESGETFIIEFGMIAPHNLDTEDYPLTGGQSADMFGWPAVQDNRNIHGPLSMAVPGQVAGMELAHQKFGTWSWEDLLSPAIESANRGLLVDWFATLAISASATELSHYPSSGLAYLPNGMPPAGAWSGPPPTITLPKLANTMRRLAKAGARDFYEGEIARSIVGDLIGCGSKIDTLDLSNYSAKLSRALTSQYRDAEIYVSPGLTAGPSLLAALKTLSEQGISGSDSESDTYLAYARSLKDVYQTRLALLGDTPRIEQPECTSHISVVDSSGNFVSLTQTLLSPFGSKVVLPKSGILMNNGIMWFDPRPGNPNSIAPNKQPLSNMCPTLVREESGRITALGASGGRRIMPAVFQLISNIVDFDMTLSQAFEKPRIDVSGTEVATVDVNLSPHIAKRIREEMPVNRRLHGAYPAMFACPNAVSRDPVSGIMKGAAYIMSPWAKVSAAS